MLQSHNCFWVKILNIESQIIGKVTPLDPRLCILHFKMTKHERLWLILCLLEAKRVIACSWDKRRKSWRVSMDKEEDLMPRLRKDDLLFI